MRAAIEQRIDEVLAGEDGRFDWIRAAVRKHRFLPLYVGWVSVLGIRPDGSFVRWDHEDTPEKLRPLNNPFLQRMAAFQGSLSYPELRALVPDRPDSAQTCEGCGGSGQIDGLPQIICQCGGPGWIIPGEPHDAAPG